MISNAGDCFFVGHYGVTTSMWQTIDLSDKISFELIDTQTVRYNLSGWIGGIESQDDYAVVSLTFLNNNGQIAMGNYTSIGLILASDRSGVTKLMPQVALGTIPAGTRSMLVCVTINREEGEFNNGYLDNLALCAY